MLSFNTCSFEVSRVTRVLLVTNFTKTRIMLGRLEMKIKNHVVLCAALVIALACVLWAPHAAAQAVYGSVFGTITDPSGAAVPGAKVTVTSATKGTTNETTTNSDGNYSVTHLIPDLYNVRAEGSGFKAFEAKNIGCLRRRRLACGRPVPGRRIDGNCGSDRRSSSVED